MNQDGNQKDLNKMLKRYVAGKATAEEINFVEAYYKFFAKEKDVLEELKAEELNTLGQEYFQAILNKINSPYKQRTSKSFYKYAAAAVLIIAVTSGLIFSAKNWKEPANSIVQNAKKVDIRPGKEQATLTLSDGSKILLDNAKNENILEEEGLTISKTKDGQLIYKTSGILISDKAVAYHTIETARGNQYQLLLPDGSRVWLNASSSLKYPASFAEDQREVTLSGEAYFEVAKNKLKPFIVHVRDQSVQVLGTSFNINSYNEYPVIRTTLVEGSVKVASAYLAAVLKPKQQAVVTSNGLSKIDIIKNIDLDEELAWKNGLFSFNNAELKDILRQLERWYDIKIDYQSVPNKRYNGMVSRNSMLSEVLNMLELTGSITFKIEEGRNLKVVSH